MTGTERHEKLSKKMKEILLRKNLLNDQGLKQIEWLCRKLASSAHGYYYILPENREKTAQFLADRWYDYKHEPGNPRSFRGGKRCHSFYSFSLWLDSNYYIIAIARKEGILSVLRQVCYLWFRRKISISCPKKESHENERQTEIV